MKLSFHKKIGNSIKMKVSLAKGEASARGIFEKPCFLKGDF